MKREPEREGKFRSSYQGPKVRTKKKKRRSSSAVVLAGGAVVVMAVELGTYGLVIGLAYGHSKWKCMFALYRSLLTAMIAGRIVWAIAEVVLLGVTGSAFTWQMFVAGAFLNAIPGIILQLILIPTVMLALDRANVLKFSQTERA